MFGVEILVNEHEEIKRMASIMRAASLEVLKGNEVDTNDFHAMVDFVTNYADKHHHQKEEEILFRYMKKELGQIANKLITHGMLVEHDLGRLHMKELREAIEAYEKTQSEDAKLDIITNATAYTYLINRHIDKENSVVFTFGETHLTDESKRAVDEETKQLEEMALKEGVQEKYRTLLETLEKKYME